MVQTVQMAQHEQSRDFVQRRSILMPPWLQKKAIDKYTSSFFPARGDATHHHDQIG